MNKSQQGYQSPTIFTTQVNPIKFFTKQYSRPLQNPSTDQDYLLAVIWSP